MQLHESTGREKKTQIAQDQVAFVNHAQDVGSGGLIVAPKSLTRTFAPGSRKANHKPIGFSGRLPAIFELLRGAAWGRKGPGGRAGYGPCWSWSNTRPKGAKHPWARNGTLDLAKERQGHSAQEMLESTGEALVEGLFGITASGGQTDDGGDAFQRQNRLRSQGTKGQEQIGDGDFAGAAAQKA